MLGVERIPRGVAGLPRAAWLRPKQTDLVPGKGQFRSRFPPIGSATVVRQRFFGIPATDTDIISAQHFWTGGLEAAGPSCYDAVAIAWAAGSAVDVCVTSDIPLASRCLKKGARSSPLPANSGRRRT